MNPKTYERLTTTCLVLAVASALSFQPSGRFGVLVGGAGLLAGVVAAVVYLINQWPKYSDTQPSDNDAKEICQTQEVTATLPKAVEVNADPTAAVTNLSYVDVGTLTYWNTHLVEASHYDLKFLNDKCTVFYAAAKSYQPSYGFRETSESDAVVARVVEIMKRLSTEENIGPYEFILSPSGTFTIRPMLKEDSFRQDDTVASLRDEEKEAPQKLSRLN